MKRIYIPIEYRRFTGGMLHSAHSLSKFLAREYELEVIAPEDAEFASRFEDLGIPVRLFGRESDWRFNWSFGGLAKLLRFRSQLKKRFDFDNSIVLLNNIGSALPFSFPGTIGNARLVYVVRGGIYKGKIKYVYRAIARNVGFIVFTSRSQKDLFDDAVTAHTKNAVIPNPVAAPNQPFRVPDSFSKIAILGYFSEGKNQMLALRSLLHLRDLPIEINFYGEAGCESDVAYLKQMHRFIRDNSLTNCHFHGYCENKNHIFESNDIVLSTSLSEGFGRSIAEAMMCRRLAIAMKIAGGPRDIIRSGETGFLVERNCPRELAEVITVATENRMQSKRIATKGYEFASVEYDEEIIAQKYIDILESLP